MLPLPLPLPLLLVMVTAAAVLVLVQVQAQGGESLRLRMSTGFQGSQQEQWEERELKDRLASRSDEEPLTCDAHGSRGRSAEDDGQAGEEAAIEAQLGIRVYKAVCFILARRFSIQPFKHSTARHVARPGSIFVVPA